MAKRYPLSTLEALKQRALAKQGRELVRHQQELEQREREVLEVTARQCRERVQVEGVLRAERDKLARGELRVQDLALRGAFEERTTLADVARGTEVEHAEEQAAVASAAARRAEQALARARVELSCVEGHHQRWQNTERKRSEDQAEEEAADIANSLHSVKRTGRNS